jgi:hypothetical protein
MMYGMSLKRLSTLTPVILSSNLAVSCLSSPSETCERATGMCAGGRALPAA